MANVVEDCLKAHNEYRAQHGAPPMKLNDKLNKMAQAWAEKCAKNEKSQHSPKEQRQLDGKSTGENLQRSRSTPPKPADGRYPVTSWYNEIKDYDFSDPGFKSGTGHFTQVVWKGSTELGVGFAKSEKGSWFFCCNYFPAGNMQGDFPGNVYPKK